MPTDAELNRLRRYAEISQIGLEMAVPIGLGFGVDYWLGTLPWFTIVGALLGPVLGFVHLLSILRRPAIKDDAATNERSP
jgi:F0F1-type ATP synthase assembly protein I